MRNRHILQSLGTVSIGAQFIYRTAQMLGPDYRGRKPHFEGQTLTVVGFKPRYVNSVMVQDPSGMISLLPLHNVDKALRSQNKAHGNVEVIRTKVTKRQSSFGPSTLDDMQEQHLLTRKSEFGCQASRSNRNYVPCGRAVTHVLEFTDEEARKCLLICDNHAGQVDKRTILEGWSDVSVTPL